MTPNDLTLVSVATFIEGLRNQELARLTNYLQSIEADGLVCPGECGCGFKDGGLMPCGMDFKDMDECVPAKMRMGTWEGMPGPLYYPMKADGTIDEPEGDEE